MRKDNRCLSIFPPFIFDRGRVKGTTSKLLEAVLEEKRREIIKEWIGTNFVPEFLAIIH